MPLRSTAVPLRAALLLVTLSALVSAAPAQAHQADPRVATVLDAVTPPLPSGVVVQAVAGIASQLVARNPTDTVLEVLGSGDRPFLRLSSAGVQGDLSSPDFLTTSNPNGAAPAAAGGAPRWVPLSRGDSWGWYDHRLHPAELSPPRDQQRSARLAEFSISFRYGGRPVAVTGHVQFEPLLGTYTVSADPGPAGLTVQALPGRLPGLFVSDPGRAPLEVAGRDGEPFLRLGADGVSVNVASRTHVEDRQARGIETGPPSTTPRFELVAPGATSYTWLDGRLAYPADLPVESVLRRSAPTVVQEWVVPATLAGADLRLTGKVSWVPEASAAEAVRAPAAADDGGPAWTPVALGGLGLLALGGVVLVLRRRAATNR